MVRGSTWDVVPIEGGVIDVREPRERVGDASLNGARELIGEPRFEPTMACACRVAVRWNREGGAWKRPHVDVEDLVAQLDVEQRQLPRERGAASARAELDLPGILRFERNEAARVAEARELEKQRGLDGAAHVGEQASAKRWRVVQQAHSWRDRSEDATVGLIAIPEETVGDGAPRIVEACAE